MGITILAWAVAMAAAPEYHFCTPNHFVALTVTQEEPYLGRPATFFHSSSPGKRICPGGRCFQQFTGAVALARYGFAPARGGATAPATLRERVSVIERSADIPEELSTTDLTRPIQDGMVTDIQMFGYDEQGMTPADRDRMRKEAPARTWRRVRQELFLNGEASPFATIEWKHTIGKITVERVVTPAACSLAIEQMFEQGRFEEVRSAAPALIAATVDPVLKARRLLFLGSAELRLDRYETAGRTLEEGLAFVKEPSTPAATEVAVTLLTTLAEVRTALGRFEEANPYLRRAIELADQHVTPGHPARLQVHLALGRLATEQNQPAKAESETRKALAIAEKQLGPDHVTTATIRSSLATLLWPERTAEAIALLERSYLALAAANPPHPEGLWARYYMGFFQLETDPAGAEAIMRDVLSVWRAHFPDQRTDVGRFLQGLAKAKARQRDFAAAQKLSAEATTLLSETLGRSHPATVAQLENQAGFLRAAKRGREAGRLEQEAARIRREHGLPAPGATVDIFSLRNGR